MKNTTKTVLIVIILIALVGVYISMQKRSQNIVVDTPVATSTVATTSVPTEGEKILAKGDIDGDGSEDKIVQEMSCGASCSFNLAVFFNKNGTFVGMPVNFGPAFNGGTAVKSSLTDVSIYNGMISLTGQGLACGTPCTETEWQKRKTVTYKYTDGKIVQISVDLIQSVNTPFEGEH